MRPLSNAAPATSWRTGSRVALLGVLGVLLSTALAFGGHQAAPTAALAGQGDVAGLVEIGGGRHMYLDCRGQGRPTVVLIAGFGNHGGIWSIDSAAVPQPQVQPAVAHFTRVCAYDRPGTVVDPADPSDRSRSDPVPQPTTAAAAVADLHALLQAGAVPGPYVLVGHSLGGLYARLYASTYPDDVAGLVLVDATSEQLLRAVLTPAQWAVLRDISGVVAPQLASYRELERIDLDVALDALIAAASARPLRQMPLSMLSAGIVEDVSELGLELPPGFQEALIAAQQASQAFLAALLSLITVICQV